MVVRTTVSLLAALAVMGTVAESEAAPGRSEHATAGARAFAKLTVRAQRELAHADRRAERVGQAAREAAAGCLDTWRAVPARHRAELFDFYFVSIAGAYFEVDGAIFGRWVQRLGAAVSIGRVTVLRRARRDLRSNLSVVRRLIEPTRKPCDTVARWQAAGFRQAARPPELRALRQVGKELEAFSSANLTRAAELVLRRGGRAGGRAAELIADGIDEKDDRVLRPCDPVVVIIEPDDEGDPRPCPPPKG